MIDRGCLILLSVLWTAPVLAAHDGVVHARSMPELSDLALAAFAVGAIWFVRRALRARFRQPHD